MPSTELWNYKQHRDNNLEKKPTEISKTFFFFSFLNASLQLYFPAFLDTHADWSKSCQNLTTEAFQPGGFGLSF